MPCRCPDIRHHEDESCSFGAFRRPTMLSPVGPPPLQSSGATVQNQHLYASHVTRRTNSSSSYRTIFKIIHNLYEKCAAYNLRHCGFQGFVASNKNYFSNFLKDLVLLFCFLLANSVVFLTIFTRMSIHMSCVLLETIKWVRRTVPTLKQHRLKGRVHIASNLRQELLTDSFSAPRITT